MNEAHRQTGRTTRMLEEAAMLRRGHNTVFVLVTDGREVKRCNTLLSAMFARERGQHGILVEAFSDYWEDAIDWKTLRKKTRPGDQEVEVVMDHMVLELRIQKLQVRMANLAKEIAVMFPRTV